MLAAASRAAFAPTLRARATIVAAPPGVRTYASRKVKKTTPPPPPPSSAQTPDGRPSQPNSSVADGATTAETAHTTTSSPSAAQTATPEPPSSSPSTDAPPTAAADRRGTSAFDIDTTLMAIADDAANGGDGQKRTGARARSDAQQSSIEKQRKTTRRIFAALGLMGIGFTLVSWSRDWNSASERKRFEGNPLGDSAFGRLRLRLGAAYEDLNAPKWEKLLPDPLPFPYQRPYTLVLDLDDLLVHSHWTREHGWRTAKRPGLDYFLGYLSQWYEIVIYTTQPYYLAAGVLEKLDPDRRFITYQLFKESCRTQDGKVVKDLSALNRDLSKVIVMDVEKERFALQPENGIVVKKWDGSRDDRELLRLVDFFEAIGIYSIPDVRQTIKAYEGTDIGVEHARRMQASKERHIEEWKASGGRSGRSAVSSWLGSLKNSQPASAQSSDGPPKTFYELERERFQEGYAAEVKHWKDNGEAIRQQMKEEQERQMKEMKLSAWGMLTGAGMRPPEQPQSS